MGRPRKHQHHNDVLVEEVTVDGITFDEIEEVAVEEVAIETPVVEEVAVEEMVEVELPETKDVFIFTNGDTGTHHVFDTKEEAEAFKVDKNGVIRLGIFNNKHNNIDVIRG